MRRREFIAGLGGAVAWPLAMPAQQATLPVVGLLASERREENLRALRQGLSEGGFVEGRNVAIEYRFAEGQYEQLPVLAADLVRRRVTMIAAFSTPLPKWDQAPRHLRRHNVLPPVPPVATQPLPSGGFGTPQPARETRSEVHVSSKPSVAEAAWLKV
jgi:hypothetical protein